ncbi:MAG: hypothetical protein ABEJ92_02525 [Halobacteriales archaeon]
MPDDLVVHLNRDGPHSIGVEPRQFRADGAFDVVLRNHGAALHVHLHLDDDLSSHATLGTANHYVDEDAVRRVRVTVDDPGEPVTGRLKLVTGYGSETAYARVTLAEAGQDDRRVSVDEALGRPAGAADSGESLEATDWPVLLLAVLAVVVAGVAAAVVGGPAAALGLFVVVAGLAVAIALLRR